DKMIEEYGFSPYVDESTFYVGFCSFKISSLVKDYDERLIDRAIKDLEFFMRRFPTSAYISQAESLVSKLTDKKAEILYGAAYFYEKQNKYYAAKKYYNELVISYAKSPWAKKAEPRVKLLQQK
ncbi:MAG: outer membrane protein assembly factor BamD, partial [Candidatus Omnitrophica bacterium]|nr:outer membrane protein assembly factor BamD [Candidatus Omnitrophota bacterium]